MQSIKKLSQFLISNNVRITAFRPPEHPHQKFIYKNLTLYIPYFLQYTISVYFREL